MKTILFLTEVLAGTHVAKLEGVYELARQYGWHVVDAEFENSRHTTRLCHLGGGYSA